MLDLLFTILVTWRVTTFIVHEDGPYGMFENIRTWFTKQKFEWIEVRCFSCMSVWVALPLAILVAEGLFNTVMLWLAGSAGAMLLENIMRRLEE